MSIYQHFRPEEKEFVDQILGFRQQVEDRYAPKLTDFLDPREQYIAKSLIGNHGSTQIAFFGGREETERKRAIIYPEYFQPEEKDFQVSLFEIHYPEKFGNISHPQVLGSLMGLGLKRGKFGDILFLDKRVQFFAAKEIGEYIRLNFHHVGKLSVSLEEIPLDCALPIQEEIEEISLTLSSFRLDNVLSSAGRISRSKAQQLIKGGVVKVNWRIEEQPSFPVEEGDVISARGIGRIKILSIGDKTKKDRWRMTVGKLK